jgi:predicted acylesterase/phospholipase RssA
VFKVVTGVSTGALTAPFAFRGKEYDALLEQAYTTISTKDVMRYRSFFGVFFSDSFAVTAPLKKYIKRLVTPDILQKIAAEHRRGRRLFVGTVNLDAQRLVVWDMGAIACKGDLELFRKVLLASSAIPTIFPPVFFQVEANGRRYDEMHVDGGTLTQMFSLYGITRDMSSAFESIGVDPAKIKGNAQAF